MVWRERTEKKVKIFNFDMKHVTALKIFYNWHILHFSSETKLKKKNLALSQVCSQMHALMRSRSIKPSTKNNTGSLPKTSTSPE